MKLTPSIIIHELKKRFHDVDTLCTETFNTFSLPRIWKPGMSFESGNFYICDGEEVPADPPEPSNIMFLFWQGEPSVSYECTGSFLIWFHDNHEIYSIMNSVQEIFSKYIEWDEILSRLEETVATPQQFLDASIHYIDLFVFVIDASFKFVADTLDTFELLSITPPPDFKRLIMPEMIQAGYNFFDSIREKREIFTYTEGPASHFFIGQNLFDGNIYIGTLAFMNWPRTLADHDKALLLHLSKYIEHSMSNSSINNSERIICLNDAVKDILNNKHIEKAELNLIMNNVGFHRNDHYCCAAIHISPDMNQVYVQYIIRIISEQIPGALPLVHEEMIAILINITYSKNKKCDAVEKLKSIAESLELHAGISGYFSEIFSSRRFYLQAKSAYYLGDESRGKETLYEFDTYSVPFMLKNCSGGLYPEMLWPAGFHRLLEHDKKSNVSYLESLRVYLEENMNGLAAAKRLNIHRNSFTARLDRLLELLDEDVDDKMVRFRLYLSFLILDQMKEREYHRETFMPLIE